MASSFFVALVALIKAIPAIERMFQQLISLYITTQTQIVRSRIADAAALAARAQTDDERYKASDAWVDAMSSARINP